VILHHVVEEFAGTEIGLVAGRDHGAEGNAERLGAVIDRKADAAGLRDDSDPLRGSDHRQLIRPYIDGWAEGRGNAGNLVVIPLGIRSGDPHSRALGQRRDGVLHRDGIAAFLGKAGGDDDGVFDAERRALLKRAEHDTRRNDHDGEIDRLPDGCDGRIAREPIDIRIVRIDRIDRAGELVLAQKGRSRPGIFVTSREAPMMAMLDGLKNESSGCGRVTVMAFPVYCCCRSVSERSGYRFA
jgi:hypothetical protein